MKKLFAQFVRETEGQDLIEYALLAATISIAVVAAMRLVAGALNTKFTDISTSIGS
jgi:pilus assembly protein Flp/PilA